LAAGLRAAGLRAVVAAALRPAATRLRAAFGAAALRLVDLRAVALVVFLPVARRTLARPPVPRAVVLLREVDRFAEPVRREPPERADFFFIRTSLSANPSNARGQRARQHKPS